MSELGLIGGSGLTSIPGLDITRREVVNTPYGEPSGPLVHGVLCGKDVTFLPRHGYGSNIPPHRVNYRANIWALKKSGISHILAVNAVGGIRDEFTNGELIVPDQIIDYTWSRGHTFFEDGLSKVVHIDFSQPYCQSLRQSLLDGAARAEIRIFDGAVYGATQGPRLETAAEINRMEKDGCDIVGMTGMPEAALARELKLCYASIAVVANAAAGRGSNAEITMDVIEENLKQGTEKAMLVLAQTIPLV